MHDEREEKIQQNAEAPLRIMGSLIGLVKPLLHIMMAAIYSWNNGIFMCDLPDVLAGQVIVHGLLTGAAGTSLSGAKHVACTYPGKTILT